MGNWFSGPSVPSKNEHNEGVVSSFITGANGGTTHGKGSVPGEVGGTVFKGAYDAAGGIARSAGDYGPFGALSEMAKWPGEFFNGIKWSGGSRSKKQRKQKKRKQTRRHRN
jgi:hypothetical protein